MEKKNIFKATWDLFKGYWSSEEKWKARGLLFVVIALNFAAVYLLVEINSWYNEFYNALQNYEQNLFWPLVGKFTFLAFLYIVIAVYAIYLRQMLQLKWRIWMTNNYLSHWLNKEVYYRLQVLKSDTDNPDQRISEDINQFVNLILMLSVGFLKELTTLAAFGVVLWNLSGVFTVPIGNYEFQVYGYMFWISLAYSIVGTFLVHLVGRKLIVLNFDQQRYEADFRFSMMRVRENSESIAFYKGENSELGVFKDRFSYVVSNFWGLMKKTKLLNFYVNGYAQLAVIVPLILASPQYFSGAMALGGLMQTISAFGRVQDALSYFVTAYDTIAQLVAVVHRLSGFKEHIDEVSSVEKNIEVKEHSCGDLVIKNLTIKLPDDKILLNNCNLNFKEGESILVMGKSGAGKSTFLRMLAGIWPYGDGEVIRPKDENMMFLPQKPYLPLGTLKAAICYPSQAESVSNFDELLEKVGLNKLKDSLEKIDDWSRILSLGEQQRLAILRAIIKKPKWLFLDEATSAMDEPLEKEMYELLKTELQSTGIVSVGHRSTLKAEHNIELRLIGDGSYEQSEIKH
ncbi:MAG: ABC transporter ATP-binding protein/permease [Selenomonadaceae bacterium]|nr:ABC transporter ATP-binding protein/permease [Selenomonadaceae bacterium]